MACPRCTARLGEVIHLEFNPLFPPDLAYQQKYSAKLAVEQNDPYEWIDAEHLSGCSLGAYLRGVFAEEYVEPSQPTPAKQEWHVCGNLVV